LEKAPRKNVSFAKCIKQLIFVRNVIFLDVFTLVMTCLPLVERKIAKIFKTIKKKFEVEIYKNLPEVV